MVDRIEIAKRFVQEQLQKRDDIVGAWVGGSVSRGEATESSDIDLGLIVEEKFEGVRRGGFDTWQDGVYIEAGLSSKENYIDLEKVLQSPFTATHMNDALILYDPTGFLAEMQKKVRAVFMEPKWLGIRVQFWVEEARKSMSGLQESVAAGDLLGICGNAGWLTFSFVSVPLLRVGITPSSTRSLIQLGKTSGELKERICEWEGSSKMSVDDVLALLPTFSESMSLLDASKWGHLPEYFAKKMEWMAKKGLHREALHSMWLIIGVTIGECRKREEPSVTSKASKLAQSWLHSVGWEGQEVLEAKLRMAASILKEVEALAADLPSVAPAARA
jgi:predicted nucleotidyltransferase